MKKLSQIILVLAAFLGSLQLQSQSTNFFAGFNSSTLAFTGDSSAGLNPQALSGFHIGTSFNFKINDMLTFQPGLTFERKGFNFETNIPGLFNAKSTFEFYYLDVPLNLMTEFEINQDLNAYVTAGPYIGLGLFGSVKTEVNSLFSNSSENEPLEPGNDFEQLDYGIGLGAGVNYQRFLLGFSYDFGLPNVFFDAPEGNFARNRVLRISLGYKLDF